MKAFKNAKVVFPDKIRDCIVVTNEGKIIDICENFDDSTAEIIDCGGLYLSPGFVDIHVHGGGNKSAMSEDYRDIIDMAEAHLKYGTTSIAPTTLAAPVEQLKKVTLSIKKAAEESKSSTILGVHYEGPYISKKYKGAQSEDNILNPKLCPPDELFELWDKVLIMGVAPEEPDVLKLGEKLRDRGIVGSIAHSAASYEQVEEAIKHGFSDITHIYNACSSCFKTGALRTAGVVEAGLTIDEITTQTIADLKHLPKGLLKLIYKCKGDEKMYLITDGLEYSACEIKENTVFTQENGISVVYENNVMLLADKSALAGSVATLRDCVRNMYKEVGVPLYSAVRMASLTPATVVGCEKSKGQIKIGCDSDLIIFDNELSIKSVYTN